MQPSLLHSEWSATLIIVLFLSNEVAISAPEGLSPRDPTWIGAWWLGFLIISIVLIVPGLAMFFFPQSGKADSNESKDVSDETSSKKKNKRTLKLVDRHIRRSESGDASAPLAVTEKIAGMGRFVCVQSFGKEFRTIKRSS